MIWGIWANQAKRTVMTPWPNIRGSSKVTRLLDFSTSVARATLWRQRSQKDFLAVFNWHQVTPTFDSLVHHKYTWTPLERFKREVDYAVRKFQVLPLHEAISRLKNGSLRGRCASFNFDDGDISIAEHVVPFLRQRGLPATFFINSAYLDGKLTYWFPILNYFEATQGAGVSLPHDLKENASGLRKTADPVFYNEVRTKIEEFASLIPNLGARLVSANWLSTLDGDQFAIGAHGHEHQRFSLMPTDWQRNDLRDNQRVLRDFRGYRPIFAVPFGRPTDWTTDTVRIACAEGLDVVLADGGINVTAADSYRRIPSDDKALAPLIAAGWRTNQIVK